MARAKQTARSEARRRYRQASTVAPEAEIEAASPAARPSASNAKATPRPNDRPNPASAGRPGFMSAVRGAYHPAHLREDLRALPKLLTHWSFLVSVVLVLGGAAGQLILPNYTGTEFAWQLLALPGSALAPQLVAGFFAPRASYLLGFIIGLEQGIVFTLLASTLAAQNGTPIPSRPGPQPAHPLLRDWPDQRPPLRRRGSLVPPLPLPVEPEARSTREGE